MKMLKITLQGKTYEVGVEVIDGAAPVTTAAPPVQAAPAITAHVAAPVPAPAVATPAPVAGSQSVTSPMPGLVMKIRVAVGQTVTADQEVLVLEAMKMESPVYAPGAGTVASILVKEGDAVSEGQVLVQLG